MELVTDKSSGWINGSAVQRFSGSAVQRFSGSAVQRLNTWIDFEMKVIHVELRPFALKIVLHRPPNDDQTGALVTNSFACGQLYEGDRKSNANLIF